MSSPVNPSLDQPIPTTTEGQVQTQKTQVQQQSQKQAQQSQSLQVPATTYEQAIMTRGSPGLQDQPTVAYDPRMRPCDPYSRSYEGQHVAPDIPHKDPPPYPGHMFYQAGYRQSLSGSEASTDLSMSSLENLSVCSAVRQEPQGEETVTVVPSSSPVNLDLHYSQLLAQIAANIPRSAVEVKNSNATFYVTASKTHPATASNCHSQTNSRTPSPSILVSTKVSGNNNGRYLETGDSLAAVRCSPVNLLTHPPRMCSSPQQNPSPLKVAPVTSDINTTWMGAHEFTAGQWLLASNHSTPTQMRRSYEMLDRVPLTRSQPDLTRLISESGSHQTQASEASRHLHPFLPSYDLKASDQLDSATIATKATKMVEKLSDENQSLREKLRTYQTKVSKLQKLEIEIERLTEQYKGLVKHSQKRENLERVLRFKLEAELDKLRDMNTQLKDQLQKALSQLSQKEYYIECDSDLRKELNRKDSVIAKLLTQNKEYMAAKERKDIETAAQKSTLQEQRAHIQVLNNALNNAQNTIVNLEDEIRQRECHQVQLEEMQTSLKQIQQAADKRQAVEEKLREKLTEHISKLRSKQTSQRESSDGEDTCSVCNCKTNTEKIGKQQDEMDDKDRRILELETEVLRWEQQYYEENAVRQLAIEAASMPKDARIAALEKSSQETEKIIAEARNDRLKHLEEVYEANKKTAEWEAKTKSLEAQLAEKEAMISVLQRHATLSRCSSVSSIVSSPLHSPYPSLITSPTPTTASLALCRHLSALDSISQHKLPALPVHTKSYSTGSSNLRVSPIHGSKTSQIQEKLQSQATVLDDIPSDSEKFSKKFWQV